MKKLKIGKNANKGITLIALVITIIVLLILAGVSIATLTGENGILTQANNSKTANEKGEASDRFKLIANEWKIEESKANGQTLEEFLNSKVASNELDRVTKNADGTFTAEVKGYEVTFNANGEITGEIIKVGETPSQPTGGADVKIAETDTTLSSQNINTLAKATGSVDGSIVKVGNEQFYVLDYDENAKTVTCLAMYCLMDGETTGIYKQTTSDTKNSRKAIAFSSTNYWYDTANSKHKDEYVALNYYVYNEQSNLYSIVEAYKTQVGGTSARLLKYEEVYNGSSYLLTSTVRSLPANGWWLGSAYSSSSYYVRYVGSGGNYSYHNYTGAYGVRPVIIFSIS